MSETALLEQVTAEIVRDYLADRDADAEDEAWAPALWATLEEAGLPRVGLPEEQGGAGGGWPEIAAVLRATARYAAPVPLAESCVLAGWLLAEAGLAVPPGPLTVAPVRFDETLELRRASDGWRLRGVATRVPWASQASALVVLARTGAGHAVAVTPPGECQIAAGANLAGEPRDRVTFADVRLPETAVAAVAVAPDALLVRGALARSIQIVGALDRVLALTVEYTRARVQFGRPLARFQAVQQELAGLAGEVAAATAAVSGAVAAADTGDGAFAVAAAKVRTAEAASAVARVAHQLHGAIGYTREHQLHRFTTRLWSWRDELGAERAWAARLGRFAAASGADGCWAWLTRDPCPAPGGALS